MKYTYNLNIEGIERLLYKSPEYFNTKSVADFSIGLGAALYIPGNRKNLVKAITNNIARTVVICLEDSISSHQIKEAHKNIIQAFSILKEDPFSYGLPFLFIRGRNLDHFKHLVSFLDEYKDILTGFVVPKFDCREGHKILCFFSETELKWGKKLYVMPILESGKILYNDLRYEELYNLYCLFFEFKEMIACIRIGSTDMLGLYGLRRSKNFTIWDNAILSSVIGDILNTFTRSEIGFVVAGSVWEYYINKKQFNYYNYNTDEVQGLIRETQQDIYNGIIGKSVIHPSQILPVLSQLIVSYSDYMDALDIQSSKGGVSVGCSSNRMNEKEPHLYWSRKIISRAHIYGVYRRNVSANSFLQRYSEYMNIEETYILNTPINQQQLIKQ